MNTFNQILHCFCSATRRLTLASVVLIPTLALGQGIIYDQMSQGRADSLSAADVLPMFLPLGQVFVPETSRLDLVELRVADYRSGSPQTLGILLHSGDALGDPVIASTDPVVVQFNPLPHEASFRTFQFPEPVRLVPGAPYVFEVVHLGGDYIAGVTFWNASVFDAYPEGGMYIAGNMGKADLWFKTGYRLKM